jgi:hypothetical protein
MTRKSAVRIDDDLYASAKLAGDVKPSRSLPTGAHRARIGREIEASASIRHRDRRLPRWQPLIRQSEPLLGLLS